MNNDDELFSGGAVVAVGIMGLLALLVRPAMWLLMFPLTLMIRFLPLVYGVAFLWLGVFVLTRHPAS